MNGYREIRPGGGLRSVVECFWTLEDGVGDGEPQRVVPDGHSELIVNHGAPFAYFGGGEWRVQPGCFFAGQIVGPLLLRPTGPARITGVRFTPDGAAPVLGMAMQGLAGRFTPVEELPVWLGRACAEAVSAADPVAVLEAALGSVAGRGDVAMRVAVERMVAAGGECELEALAAAAGLSVRQFERRFLAAVGLSPKKFCRMRRFQRVFRMVGEGAPKWVEAAIACGYFDQAHLIRDFREFSGEPPAALLAPEAGLAMHFLADGKVTSRKTPGGHSRPCPDLRSRS